MVVAVAAFLPTSSAEGKHGHDVPRYNKTIDQCHKFAPCVRDVRWRGRCFRAKDYRHKSKCYIRYAAHYYGQDVSKAFHVADRESHYHPGICNSEGSGACGLFQFMPGTWVHAYTGVTGHYGKYDYRKVFSPKWASLGAMWMWSQGEQSQWSTY